MLHFAQELVRQGAASCARTGEAAVKPGCSCAKTVALCAFVACCECCSQEAGDWCDALRYDVRKGLPKHYVAHQGMRRLSITHSCAAAALRARHRGVALIMAWQLLSWQPPHLWHEAVIEVNTVAAQQLRDGVVAHVRVSKQLWKGEKRARWSASRQSGTSRRSVSRVTVPGITLGMAPAVVFVQPKGRL